ncbi:hypothetical protein FACS1894116_04040 [Betaproteobacteria bacterium]|nr:hypothetical protein FACS1894116_04040 [Betaproteobacteria bacterium]GHU22570.1 hypothetical protein FACS189488_03390 [Betaproteobacteria bacterium]
MILSGGAGTALIAAEKSGRVARLIELDPKYVDVIVRRWEGFTGEKVGRVTVDMEACIKSDGLSVDR